MTGPQATATADARIALHVGDHLLLTELDGGIVSSSEGGFYASDTRFVSTHALTINGQAPALLSASQVRSFSARHVLVAGATADGFPPARSDGLLLTLDRTILEGVHEDYDLVNHGRGRTGVELAIGLAFDFADMFDVRGLVGPRERGTAAASWSAEQATLTVAYRHGAFVRTLRLVCDRYDSPPAWRGDRLVFEAELGPGERWHTCLHWLPLIPPSTAAAVAGCHALTEETRSAAARERETTGTWPASVPTPDVADRPRLETANASVQAAWEQAVLDLDSLRLARPEAHRRELEVPAAGIPWFLTLFGRDSLITARQALPVFPSLARGTLQRLAELQATIDDPVRDMEPGKILHEIRHGEIAELGILPFQPYYGTHDATSLYVILLAEAYRWTGDLGLLRTHLAAAEAAMGWIDRYGDRDGDGFQEYATRSPHGFYHQGWKDAADAIPDERGARPPLAIALCELQGYAYEAKLSLAEIYRALARNGEADRLERSAEELRQRFEAAFWWESEGTYYLGLDGEKRPIRSVASNPGHLLASGIVAPERAARVADRLLAPDMWSGWGIRTLAAGHPAYDPLSYHTGSVWPHDNAHIAAGFARYGLRRQATQVAEGLVEASAAFAAHRLPELFAGFDRTPGSFPVRYPGANVPQAWSASAVLQLIMVLCGLRAIRPPSGDGRIHVDPALPQWMPELALHRVQAGHGTLSLRLSSAGVELLDNSTGYQLVEGPP